METLVVGKSLAYFTAPFIVLVILSKLHKFTNLGFCSHTESPEGEVP